MIVKFGLFYARLYDIFYYMVLLPIFMGAKRMDQQNSSERIAFLVWNTFQLLHFKSLLLALPNAVLIIEQRKRSVPIELQLLSELPNEKRFLSQKEIHNEIDGKFDVLVVQTVFEQIHLFRKTKIAMLQYGYAKEPHNYGAWRAFADLNLVYGQHAYNVISYFSPTVAVGCPRYDQWFDLRFHLDNYYKFAPILDNSKKTILYAPSWGELSSFPFYMDVLYQLTNQYNVIVKMHHNSVLLGYKEHNLQNLFFGVHFFYENEDIISLISVSDIVISDFSGAIFDAAFCRKPVVLLNIPNIDQITKVDNFSLEISQREKLGRIVESPDELEIALEDVSQSPKKYLLANELYQYLFVETENATKQAVSYIIELAKNHFSLSQQQLYIRHSLNEFYEERYKNKNNKKRFAKLKRISKKLLTVK